MSRSISTRLTYTAANSNVPGTDTFVLAGGSTINLDVEMQNIVACKAGIEYAYAVTGAVTGITVNVIDGFATGGTYTALLGQSVPCALGTQGFTPALAGAGTSVATFMNNTNPTTMAAPTINSTNTVTRTSIIFADPILKSTKWQRLQITNNDLVNSVTIRIYIDMT